MKISRSIFIDSVLSGLAVMLLFNLGCKSSESLKNEQDLGLQMSTQQPTPEILMINFFINARDSITIRNQIKSPGKLRSENPEAQSLSEGDLVVSFLGDSRILCSKSVVRNPLAMKAEYSASDNLSSLQMQTIVLDSAEFFVRTQMGACIKYISVERFQDGDIVELAIFQLTDHYPR